MPVLSKKTYTMENLVSYTPNGGFAAASFVEIKQALIDRYKLIYGDDIDVSDASADGQWITAEALMINNILRAVEGVYSDINPATAQGAALDAIAALSNITRRAASQSTCDVLITAASAGTAPLTIEKDTAFVDVNGHIWYPNANKLDSLPATLFGTSYAKGDSETLPLICEDAGPIACEAGTIDGFAEINSGNSGFSVSQPYAGREGSAAEGDGALRARLSGASWTSVTVAEGLEAALLRIPGVRDAKIISHESEHWVEALIEKDAAPTAAGAVTDASSLGSVDRRVYETLRSKTTPGIPSLAAPSGASHAVVCRITRGQTSLGDKETTVWSDVVPIGPLVQIKVHATSNFNRSVTPGLIISAVASLLNGLPIMEDPTLSDIVTAVRGADPRHVGQPTLWLTADDIKIGTLGAGVDPKNAGASDADKASDARSCYRYSANEGEFYAASDGSYSNVSGLSFGDSGFVAPDEAMNAQAAIRVIAVAEE